MVEGNVHNLYLGNTYTLFVMLYLCQTHDMFRTFLHVCPSVFFFFFFWKKCKTLLGHGSDTYILFIFTLNPGHLFSYILFTLLDFILGLNSDF